MRSILLDGTVIQYLYLRECGHEHDERHDKFVQLLETSYDKIYYEGRSGQSNFQAKLHSSSSIGSKLFAIDEDIEPTVDNVELPLLRETIIQADKYPLVMEAIQEYENLKKGPPRKRETLLGYTVRVLLLARHFGTDIWAWEGRAKIIEALFMESDVEIKDVIGTPGLYEAGPCVFPFLPSASLLDAKEYVFRYFGYAEPFGTSDPKVIRTDAKLDKKLVVCNSLEASVPVKVFISYSHKDDEYRRQLETHLSLMKRRGVIDTWSDRDIMASEEWKGNIDKAMESAKVVLLLVSADFCASDYCWDVEMKRALERHHDGEARVIPIAVRACDWGNAAFSKLQGLPTDLTPISNWPDRDSAWLDVVKELDRIITAIGNA